MDGKSDKKSHCAQFRARLHTVLEDGGKRGEITD